MSAMMKRAMSQAFNYIFVASDPDQLLSHVLVLPIEKIVLLLKMIEVFNSQQRRHSNSTRSQI